MESLAAIAAMRYGNDGYFWVNDTAAVMIMHPILPDWNGTYKGDVADANGVFYIRELANMARDHGQGIVEYQFRKPGNEKPTPKFSYVKLVPEWGWAVGTGIYVDDVKAEAAGVIRAVAIAAAFHGVEDPADDDVRSELAASPARLHNRTRAVMVRYQVGPGAAALEWIDAKTDWTGDVGTRHASQVALSFNFAFVIRLVGPTVLAS